VLHPASSRVHFTIEIKIGEQRTDRGDVAQGCTIFNSLPYCTVTTVQIVLRVVCAGTSMYSEIPRIVSSGYKGTPVNGKHASVIPCRRQFILPWTISTCSCINTCSIARGCRITQTHCYPSHNTNNTASKVWRNRCQCACLLLPAISIKQLQWPLHGHS
jgi:hypothetical protein